jgi:SAM-dependent methyltransferase
VDQAEYWNGAVGQTWAAEQDRIDRVLVPLRDVAIAAAGAQPGERVLDAGCGCGETTLALARAVGERGEVVGVDLSEPMLARARARAAAGRHANTRFVMADASRFADARPFDLVFSRFGVMFFPDPPTAFANLARALRPGGRVAFICWRAADENSWAGVPLEAVLTVVPRPEPPPPGAPGPFSLADADHVRGLLAGAGFANIDVSARDVPMATGALEEATDYALTIGPAARAANAAPPELQARVRAPVREALRGYEKAGVVTFPAAVWVVTATIGLPSQT